MANFFMDLFIMMVKKLAKVSRFTMNKKFAEIRKFDCIRQNSILVWGRPYIMPAKNWVCGLENYQFC